MGARSVYVNKTEAKLRRAGRFSHKQAQCSPAKLDF